MPFLWVGQQFFSPYGTSLVAQLPHDYQCAGFPAHPQYASLWFLGVSYWRERLVLTVKWEEPQRESFSDWVWIFLLLCSSWESLGKVLIHSETHFPHCTQSIIWQMWELNDVFQNHSPRSDVPVSLGLFCDPEPRTETGTSAKCLHLPSCYFKWRADLLKLSFIPTVRTSSCFPGSASP